MINLRDEIEKLKVYECEVERTSTGVRFLRDCYIKKDLDNLLNQYNIITAPKEINLSEIVSKIQEQANEEIYFNREYKAIGYGEPDEDWRQSTWQPFVIFRDMKIVRVCMPMAEITKWVYTLWIAGTTIIDDLEGNKNEKML